MPTVFEKFSDWIKRSIGKEGIVLTEETQKLVTWLSKAQNRPVETVVNDLLAAELEQRRRNEVGLPRWARLTRREQDVAVLVIQGYTNSQIARTLAIDAETVRTHILHIQIKYGVRGKSLLREHLLVDRLDADPDVPGLKRLEPPQPD